MIRGRGGFRGRGGYRGGNNARADLPFNKEGRIAPYTKGRGSRKPGDQGRFKSRHQLQENLQSDKINDLSSKYWAPQTAKKHLDFDPEVIVDIYQSELISDGNTTRRKVMLLEFSQYLENYLWPNFKAESTTSKAHIISIVMMVNEKFRERVPAWSPFQKSPEHFPAFFHQVMEWSLEQDENKISLKEQTALLIFLDHCFTSMEVDLIRNQIQRLVSLSMWYSLMDRRREYELRRTPRWKKFWKAIQKKDAKETEESLLILKRERNFLRSLIDKFFNVLNRADSEEPIAYCENFLMLMIDLEALLPTRRFFNTVLDDSKLVVRCSLSALNGKREDEGKLFSQLLDQLKFYARFEISDETGDPLDDIQMMQIHYDRITSLQKAMFVRFPEMRKFALATVASIDDRASLAKHFGSLKKETLYDVAEYLFLVPPRNEDNDFCDAVDREFLIELLITRHEKRESQLKEINEMPLYPTEEIIWDENVVPGEVYNGDGVLALPKLNIQFLTLLDYLLRNFKLFQLESTYEIRGDVEDAVTRLKPWTAEDGEVIFGGWARMALPLISFCIVEVAKPNIGEKQPSRVRADITLNLSVKEDIKREWEGLRRHDVVFLITVRPPVNNDNYGMYNFDEEFVSQVGLMYVRGCEVEGMLDENGRVIEEGPEPKPQLVGEKRTFRVLLDCNQYHADMENVSAGGEDVYESFNIVMRRKPKENNFKAVLETIRELMNTQCVVPDFLHDIVLGYGDPGAAHYTKMPNQIKTINFNDTFLSFEHLRHSFPHYDVKVETSNKSEPLPPFRVTFNEGNETEKPSISVETVVTPSRGPYPFNAPKKNNIPFTPTQVEAIRSGTNPGLTLIVGPPGTGKTDVAVQIISNLYHNFPEQRTLIVTHSNQALNQLFEKIMALDVDERHLLRLGHGEESLETEKDFSRYGRVNYVLGKRLKLLEEVGRLKDTLQVLGDVAYTCETASYFFLYHVLSRWEKYMSLVNPKDDITVAEKTIPVDDLDRHFPFHGFFANAPHPLFHGRSYREDYEVAQSCWRYIQDIFTQLDEFRAFELLRSGLDRTRYLCVKEAKIIAMTCTHAALKRKELVTMGFKYDNILMEESAQILEIETFIPLLLQNPQDGRNRLKRWIMIGDHHQLPPVIKNMAFQKFSNMEQSLFTRLVRLGVPTVDLDAQGRARPSICSLYNWRYRCLGNLGHVLSKSEYLNANAGLSFDYQLINVPDFNGVGESQPSPFFYQNLAEAEYVVALFMYMRLIGYPAEKISLLTTYNGQKHLLRDVVNARCANNPMIGKPHKITTVDKYQGQQNDYILLSLVKTHNVGHLRDVRRLVVAMSRARLGLYIFARVGLFRDCFELQPAFNLLTKRPQELHLCPNEVHPTTRQANVTAPNPLVIYDMQQMTKFVYDFYASKVAAISELNRPKIDLEKNVVLTKPIGKTGQHPGDDRDSDDEMEGNKSILNEIVNEIQD